MDITLIIVNYKTRDYLKSCLQSVLTSSDDLKLQVIVVDNDSQDGSIEMVHNLYPDVELIPNKENMGFVAANNQGIKRARGRYILLLNPDTVLFKDTLIKSLSYMDNHPDVGCMGIKTLDGTGKIDLFGHTFPSEIKIAARLLMIRKILPNYWIIDNLSQIVGKYISAYADRDMENEVEMVGGHYMFLRAETVHMVGDLDEDYWADIEDSDYCFRLRKKGWKVMYWPGTSLIHFGGSIIERRNFSLQTYLRVNQNFLLFFKKNKPSWRFFLLRSIFILGFIPQIFLALCLFVLKKENKDMFVSRIAGAFILAKISLFPPGIIKKCSRSIYDQPDGKSND